MTLVLILRRDHTGVLSIGAGSRPVEWWAVGEDAVGATAEGARFDLVVDIRDLFPERAAAPRWGGTGTVDGLTYMLEGGASPEGLRLEGTVAP